MIIAAMTVVIMAADIIGRAILETTLGSRGLFMFRLSVGITVTIICFIVIVTWRTKK
jgi:hypothetical protein